MDLQAFLVDKFTHWSPPEPEVVKKTKNSILLDWHRVEPFHFIADQLLYRVEKKDKMPPWYVVYRGGKTTKEVDNLAPRHPHNFRLKVIVKATAVPTLADRAVQFYGDEATVYNLMKKLDKQTQGDSSGVNDDGAGGAGDAKGDERDATTLHDIGDGNTEAKETSSPTNMNSMSNKWLESRWSQPTWTSTDTDGTSAVCFCMAVRCGYIKQVQGMLDERPALIGIVNSTNGFTPLATAVRKEPEVVKKTKNSILLDWHRVEPFHFIADQLLYRVEKKDKMPPWYVVYRGGKTTKEVDNLAPRHPHNFRLKVIVKATAVPTLADRAVQFYGDEATVYNLMKKLDKQTQGDSSGVNDDGAGGAGDAKGDERDATTLHDIGDGNTEAKETSSPTNMNSMSNKWLESRWSQPTWTSTDTDGTSAVCFCMAVRCGYIKQVQGMLDERPALIGIVNSTNGFTPLATAVRKGDINTVRFLLCAGAEVEQRSSSGQSALHLAVLTASMPIAQLLLDHGADFQGRDVNGLRVEHYAVDSCSTEMLRYILDSGGDVDATDNNGWTPLFRALCQGATTEMIEELVVRGSAVDTTDHAGLPLTSVARLLTNRQGRNRDSILRLVDSNYPHEKALANFTRLTKKIYNVHSLLKLPSLQNKKNL